MLEYNTLIVLAGTCLLGIVGGVIGSFAVLRGRALMGDALAHAALPGLCVAFLILRERNFVAFMVGAVAAGIIGVLIVALLRHSTRVKDDAAIGIVLSVFFGLGIALSRIAQNLPGGNRAGLDNYIYGKAAGMLLQDVLLIGGVSAAVLLVTLLLFKEFTLLSFDRGFAAVQGWPVLALDLVLMALLVLTTVIGLPAVGVVLMAALLIIPGATARFWTNRLSGVLILSAIFGAVAAVSGTLLSAWVARLPTGPMIVLAGAAMFLISMLVAPERGVLSGAMLRFRTRRRVARQNLLRTVYELAEDDGDPRVAVSAERITARRAWSAQRAASLLRDGCRRGLVVLANGHSYRLTADGLSAAASVVRVHRLWEVFLIEEARIAADHVDRDADEIEHVLSADVVQHLEHKLVESGRWPEGPDLPPPSPHQPETPPGAGSSGGQ